MSISSPSLNSPAITPRHYRGSRSPEVRWEKGHLSRLEGKRVRFRLLLRREDAREPRFYAATLKSTSN